MSRSFSTLCGTQLGTAGPQGGVLSRKLLHLQLDLDQLELTPPCVAQACQLQLLGKGSFSSELSRFEIPFFSRGKWPEFSRKRVFLNPILTAMAQVLPALPSRFLLAFLSWCPLDGCPLGDSKGRRPAGGHLKVRDLKNLDFAVNLNFRDGERTIRKTFALLMGGGALGAERKIVKNVVAVFFSWETPRQ